MAHKTYESSFKVVLCDQSSQTDEIDDKVAAFDDEADPLLEVEATETASPLKDPSFEPSKSDEISDDSQSEIDESTESTPPR